MDISVRIAPSIVLSVVIVLIVVHATAAAMPQSAAWLLPCFVLSSLRLMYRQAPRLPWPPGRPALARATRTQLRTESPA